MRIWAGQQALGFRVLIDPANALGHTFGFKAVPNGILLDRDGIVRWLMAATFSIKKPDIVAQMEAAVREAASAAAPAGAARVDEATQAQRLYREGAARMERGDRVGAAELWRRATELDPDDFVIRKQLWRALHPERFGETLDLGWQKEQMKREAEVGRAGANPLP